MTMACIERALGLFRESPCAAWTVAGAAFLLGAVASCLLHRAFGRCKCGAKRDQGCAAQRRGGQGDVKFEKRHPAPADGSIEIYVGNLSYDLTEDALRKAFEAFGKVNSARIITNRYNGKSKGFGFVHMPNRAEADAACAALNDKDLMGRRLKCNEAKNVS